MNWLAVGRSEPLEFPVEILALALEAPALDFEIAHHHGEPSTLLVVEIVDREAGLVGLPVSLD